MRGDAQNVDISEEVVEIMEEIFRCGYYCESFNNSQFPSLQENYIRYEQYY